MEYGLGEPGNNGRIKRIKAALRSQVSAHHPPHSTACDLGDAVQLANLWMIPAGAGIGVAVTQWVPVREALSALLKLCLLSEVYEEGHFQQCPIRRSLIRAQASYSRMMS